MVDYYTQEMVAGEFENCFSIKRYLGGGVFEKVFTAEQRSNFAILSLLQLQHFYLGNIEFFLVLCAMAGIMLTRVLKL